MTPRRRFAATLGFVSKPLCGLLCLAVIALYVHVVQAQSINSVSGHVTDEQNASITGAEVRLIPRTGGAAVVATNANGYFTFTTVMPGDYVLELRASGFASVALPIAIRRGESVTKDVTLSVEAVSETVIVTPMGTAQRVDETSKAITVLDSVAIETKREISLSESLRGIPGLRIQQQGSPGALTSVRLRGQRPFDTAVLLDGLRVRDASDINGSAVPVLADLLPLDLDRVEVLRGTGAGIYGTNALGGVINLVSAGGTGHPKFEFGFDGGSLGLFRGRFKSSGGLGTRAGYSFGVTRLDVRRGIDGHDEYGNTAGSTRIYFNPQPTMTLSGNFYLTTSNARINDSPFAFNVGSMGPYPPAIEGTTFQPDFNNPDQGRRNLVWVGALRWAQQVNDKVSYNLAYQHVGNNRRNYNGPLIDPAFRLFYVLFNPFFFSDFEFVSILEGKTDTFDARTNLRLGRRNLVTFGFEYERESVFQKFIPSFFGAPEIPQRQTSAAVIAQDQLFFFEDRLQISVGARGQFFRLRAADRPGFLREIKPENAVTGDGAISYFIRSSQTKLRAHAGNGFRAPSIFERFGEGFFPGLGFTQFGDPTLRPELSVGVDAGFDQTAGNDRARFGVTWFYTRLQRAIVFDTFLPTDPLGLRRFNGYQNRPGGISRGVESYLEAAPWRGSNLWASYTYTNSDRFVNGRGLQPEFVTPKHLVGLTLNQRLRKFQVSFDLNRTGEYIAPVFNNFTFAFAELTFPGYTKADLYGSYGWRSSERVKMTLFGGADNVFDVKYFENGFRAPGIMARGGVTVEIK